MCPASAWTAADENISKGCETNRAGRRLADCFTPMAVSGAPGKNESNITRPANRGLRYPSKQREALRLKFALPAQIVRGGLPSQRTWPTAPGDTDRAATVEVELTWKPQHHALPLTGFRWQLGRYFGKRNLPRGEEIATEQAAREAMMR